MEGVQLSSRIMPEQSEEQCMRIEIDLEDVNDPSQSLRNPMHDESEL